MGRAGRGAGTRGRAVMMVTGGQFVKATKTCEGLSDSSSESVVEVKVEESDDDPLGGGLDEEDEPTSESESDKSPDDQHANISTKRTRINPPPNPRRSSAKPQSTMRRGTRGRSRVMDGDIARFIATNSCRTRILDKVFNNPPHQPCREVGGCDNCVKKNMEETSVPDYHAASRATQRKEVELQFILEDHEELAQGGHKPVAKTRRGAELEIVKKALVDWRKRTFEVERKNQDLELEDIMTDRALASIARTRGMEHVDALEKLTPLWPSRERWGENVVEVLRQQTQSLHITEGGAPAQSRRPASIKPQITVAQNSQFESQLASVGGRGDDETANTGMPQEPPSTLIEDIKQEEEAITHVGSQSDRKSQTQARSQRGGRTSGRASRGRGQGRGRGQVRGIPSGFLSQFSVQTTYQDNLSTPGAGPSQTPHGQPQSSHYRTHLYMQETKSSISTQSPSSQSNYSSATASHPTGESEGDPGRSPGVKRGVRRGV